MPLAVDASRCLSPLIFAQAVLEDIQRKKAASAGQARPVSTTLGNALLAARAFLFERASAAAKSGARLGRSRSGRTSGQLEAAARCRVIACGRSDAAPLRLLRCDCSSRVCAGLGLGLAQA